MVLQNDFNLTTETKEIITAHRLIYSQVDNHTFCEACVAWEEEQDKSWKNFTKLFLRADNI